MAEPVDHAIRRQALDPARSFIVQAPAGSGKTRLLVNRFLGLLATVEAPEQVLAITFTRKAAAEMRQRILFALQGLDSDGRSPADAETLTLADRARARDDEQGWDLLRNPRRLRVQTIDSFCQELVRRMPWSARFGSVPAPVEDASQFYHEAADATLALIEDRQDTALAGACSQVLQLVDANRGQAESLLANLLDQRDRWMQVLENHDRGSFEGWWRDTITDTLAECDRLLNPAWRQTLATVATRAARQVLDPDNNARPGTLTRLAPWADRIGFPAADCAEVALWRGLAHLLLTAEGAIRKPGGLNRNLGFPPGESENKQRLQGLLEAFADMPDLERAWQRVTSLPDPVIGDGEWRSIDALLKLLPVSAAVLSLRFNEAHATDFTEIAQRANLALGNADEPSDLTMALDYQLRHVLMDEFQDTSSGQIELLTRLLSGWTPGDGRSLFLVGDPMQSIYRFREAEVGIFMHVQDHGVGDIRPEELHLAANFRSAPELVERFNAVFPGVMPRERSIVRGAVEYSRAEAHLPSDPGASFTVHAAIERSADDEAKEIADCIADTLRDHPGEDIAVLGRARGHLAPLVNELIQRGIPFQGVKLQRLGERQAVQDLLALTLVLVQPADDVAWFGLLRAPWGGASLSDLVTLAGEGGEVPVLEAISEDARLGNLDPDVRKRIERTRNVVTRGLVDRARLPLHRNLEACWLRLGGPAVVEAEDLDNCRRLIALVGQLAGDGIAVHAESLETALTDLFAEHHVEQPVKLMTIHGAKGLEFGTVIVPGLERYTRGDSSPLLRWKRLPGRLLIAPRPPSGEASATYDYLGALEAEHQANERGRLLYVACTRARRRLHLFGSAGVDRKKGELRPPAKSSLLALLWSAVEPRFEAALSHWSDVPEAAVSGTTVAAPPLLRRLDADWTLPDLPSPIPAIARSGEDGKTGEPLEFDWARESARIVGIVVHQALQWVDREGWTAWKARRFGETDRQLWRRRLSANGLPPAHLDGAANRVETALCRVQRDDQAAWIFSEDHTGIRTEWPLTGLVDREIRNAVLDRSFVDTDGTRWVIDFKSSRHDDEATLDAFLAEELERYRNAMMRYSTILEALDGNPARGALYYPMLGRLVRYD